jgi:RNA polymerase sigma factor (sigma-70 family)
MMDGRSGLRRYLRQLLAPAEVARLPDDQLLDRYIGHNDDSAFAALVHRHGPMVLGVCERVLGDAHAAEDAFQATFLVLIRSATSLRSQATLSHWLYIVAYRTAIRARSCLRRRQSREREKDGMDMLAQAAIGEADWRDVRPILDDELNRLPPRYRKLLILHYLEAKSQRQIAREMQVASGSMSTLLNRARNLLRSRLLKRGVLVSTAALTTSMAKEGSAAVPTKLAAATLKSATAFAKGTGALVGGGSQRAIRLAMHVLQARVVSNITVGALLLPLAISAAALATALEITLSRNPPSTEASVSGAVGTAHPVQGLRGIQIQSAGKLQTTSGTLIAVTIKNGGMVALAPQGHCADVILWRFIDNEICGTKPFACLQGHTARVLAGAFSVDGSTLVTGGQDGTIRIWDIDSQRERTVLRGHRLGIKSVALSKDSHLLVSGGIDGAVKLWDLPTGSERMALAGHRASVHALAFSPDGDLVASACQDGNIKLWETATGNARGVLVGHTDIVNSLHFSNSGQRLATASADGTARIWNVSSGKELATFAGDGKSLNLVSFTRDGTLLVTHADNAIRLWPLAADCQGGLDPAAPESKVLLCFVDQKLGRWMEGWRIIRGGASSIFTDGNRFELTRGRG